ncbi:hypothetical protein Tco_0087338 [Tanacetum coccineum]
MARQNAFLNGPLKEEVFVAQPERVFVDPDHQKKSFPFSESFIWIKAAPRVLILDLKLTAFSDADHAGCLDTRQKQLWRDTVPWVINFPSCGPFKYLVRRIGLRCLTQQNWRHSISLAQKRESVRFNALTLTVRRREVL